MAFFCPAGLEWVPGCASGRIAGPDRDSLGSQGAPWGCPKVMKFAYLKYFNSYMVKPCSKHVETQLFFPGISMMGGWRYWFVICYPREGDQVPNQCWAATEVQFLSQDQVSDTLKAVSTSALVDTGVARTTSVTRWDAGVRWEWKKCGDLCLILWRYYTYCKLKRYIQI